MDGDRRANSVPNHALGALLDSLQDLELFQENIDGRIPTSPSFVESRSPPTFTAFSPVFDLELGGTPQEKQPPRSRASHLRRTALTPVAFRQLPPSATAAPAAVRQQLHAGPRVAAAAAAAPCSAICAAGLDRSQSDLQVVLGVHPGAKAEILTPAAERLLGLCKPTTELECELSRCLRAFRAARIAKPHASAPAAADVSSSAAPASPAPGPAATIAAAATAASGGVSSAGPIPGEIEALAFELQSEGFLVQILDGQRVGKDARSCLRTLKHRFLVCLGRGSPPQRRSLQGNERRLDGPQQQQGQQQQGQAPAQRLAVPLVVEVRFREQFLIANPTRDYERLLMALPVAFVGPLERLDAAVELMAAEVAAVFREARRSLPPWRTKGAMLSKWAPSHLLDLERMLRQMQQQQRKERVEEPTECERSWGSGIADLPRGISNDTPTTTSVSEPLYTASVHTLGTAATPEGDYASDLTPQDGRSQALLLAGVTTLDADMAEPDMVTDPWVAESRGGGEWGANGTGSGSGPSATAMVMGRSNSNGSSAAPSKRSLRTPHALPGADNAAAAAANVTAAPTLAAAAPAAYQQQQHLPAFSLAESGMHRAQVLLGGGDDMLPHGSCPEERDVSGTTATAAVPEPVLDGSDGGRDVSAAVEPVSADLSASKGRCHAQSCSVSPGAVEGAAGRLSSASGIAGTGPFGGKGAHGDLTFPILPAAAAAQSLLSPVAQQRPQDTAPEAGAGSEQPLPHQQQQRQGPQPQGGGPPLSRVPSLPPPPRSAFSPFASFSMPEVSDGGDACCPAEDDRRASALGIMLLARRQDDGSGTPGGMEPVAASDGAVELAHDAAVVAASSPLSAAGIAAVNGLTRTGADDVTAAAAQAAYHGEQRQEQQQRCMQMSFTVGSHGSTELPEFTLKHSALAPPIQHYDLCDPYGDRDVVRHRDAVRAGGASRGAALPMPTPTRATPLSNAASAATAAADLAVRGGVGGVLGGAGSPAAALGGGAQRFQPLAAGAMGVAASGRQGAPPANVPYGNPGGGGGAGGGFQLQFPKQDGLRITRRSSSDLSRAANKFKNAKSLLAAALRRATGSASAGSGGSGGGGPAAAGSPAAGSGGAGAATAAATATATITSAVTAGLLVHRNDRQERDTSDKSPAVAAAGAEAGAAAGAAAAPSGGGPAVVAKQVALAGGVMTRPSERDPAWARIATVRWDQPAPAGRPAAAATATTRGTVRKDP